MEIELESSPRPSAPLSSGRSITPQRLKYEAEIAVFKSRYGDLENVRKTLGFSRRKMCQLLLIDPSAWSRWHSAGNAPPPHIFRALEWFLILEGKTELHPRLSDIYLKSKPPADLEPRVEALRTQVARLKAAVWLGPFVSAVLVALGFWLAHSS